MKILVNPFLKKKKKTSCESLLLEPRKSFKKSEILFIYQIQSPLYSLCSQIAVTRRRRNICHFSNAVLRKDPQRTGLRHLKDLGYLVDLLIA